MSDGHFTFDVDSLSGFEKWYKQNSTDENRPDLTRKLMQAQHTSFKSWLTSGIKFSQEHSSTKERIVQLAKNMDLLHEEICGEAANPTAASTIDITQSSASY